MEEGDRFKNSIDNLIKNPETGKYIHINRDGDIIMGDSGQDFALWDIKEAGTGDTTVTISNGGSGKSVCLLGNKDSVESAKCDKSREQNWNLMYDEDTKNFRIKYKKDDTCMEVRMNSSYSKAKLTLEKCNNIKYQKFDIVSAKPTRRMTDRIIPNSDAKKCMQAERNSDDDFVVVAGSCKRGEAVGWSYNDKTNQFEYKDDSSNKERCLDAKNGSNEVATISKCDVDARSQKWRKRPSTNGRPDGTIESYDINDFCMKLNMSTYEFMLRRCDRTKSDQRFTYESINKVSEIE